MTAGQSPPKFRHLAPRDLAALVAQGSAPRMIDVREAHEWALARIEGAENLPLSEIQSWWQQLDPAEAVCFQCHRGNRSAAVCCALAAEGFSNLFNLDGGLDAWAESVDPSMPRY